MKLPINVTEVKLSNGMVVPHTVQWPDGRVFRISRVLFYSIAPDNEYEGIRYTVMIGRVEKYIYRANRSWYVMASRGGDWVEKAHHL